MRSPFRHVAVLAAICGLSLALPVLAADAPVTADQAAQQGVVDTEKLNEGNAAANPADGSYETARVLEVKADTTQGPHGATQVKTYTVEMRSGAEKGKTRVLHVDVADNPFQIDPRAGDKIIVYLVPDPNGGQAQAYLESFDRRGAIYWLIALFVLTLVLLAGWQGFKVAASILVSVLIIGFVLIPAFLKGVNPVPIALFLAALLAGITAVLSTGWNRKSLMTVVGTVGGTLVAYLVSDLFAHWAHLSGLASDEDRLFFDKNPLLNPQGLLFAGIIIASLGVVEDVAVSIASGIMEVRMANMRLGFKDLFRAGMTVGRDHMSALANTLVFAYVGGSLSTLLLYTQYGGAWAKFLNFDGVVDEIIRSLSGTIGLTFTVPITALLGAWLALRVKDPRLAPQPVTEDPLKKATGWQGDHGHGHAHVPPPDEKQPPMA